MIRRRSSLFVVLVMSIALPVVVFMPSGAVDALRLMFFSAEPHQTTPVVDPFLIDLEERTFRFFWDTANPQNGLVPDRYPTPSFSSIAAVGFALTAYPVGVERGYVTREQARDACWRRCASSAMRRKDPARPA